MESNKIISALEALAQEHRFAAFRQLVKTGPSGLTPSRLRALLDLPASTLSFHLSQLRHAGLVRYLIENCCDDAVGVPAECTPFAKDGTQSTRRRE